MTRWSAARCLLPLCVVVTGLCAAACGTVGLGVSGGDAASGADSSSPTGGDSGRTGRDGAADATVVQETGSLIPEGGLSSGDATYITCVPKTCAELGATCGPMGDGCGGVIQCGNCAAPATCGGGGKPSVCGGNNNCKVKTCADWGATCGPMGDGCGGLVQCGGCAAPQTCGGGGTASQCGGNTGCVQRTCAGEGVTCGPIGDGCGGIVQCGNCASPETCGGGGTTGVCGVATVVVSDAGDAGDAGARCTPASCASLGFTCGPAGDGCGNLLQCGVCASPATCGGGLLDAGADAAPKPGVCGGATTCKPKTCADLGVDCGPAGDGCGGALDCGTCKAPQTCGGGAADAGADAGARPGVCGGTNACVPRDCTALGFNCGPAGDGCGGLISSCGTCKSPETCGGALPGSDAGAPGVCGPTSGGGVDCDASYCHGIVSCEGGATTSVSGSVYAPNGVDPLYNALVYIPTSTPAAAFAAAVACDQCSNGPSAITSATTAPDGTFTLLNVPAGADIPMVIQLGRWRRQLAIPSVAACGNTELPASLTKLPSCHTGNTKCAAGAVQGDIPLMAIVTGSVDALECVLPKIGLDSSEFGNPGGANRVQFYQGNTQPGASYACAASSSTVCGAAATPTENSLWASASSIDPYDMVMFACQGEEVAQTNQKVVVDYASAGGRVFATHYNYTWLNTSPGVKCGGTGGAWTNPFIATANWNCDDFEDFKTDGTTGYINTTFADGQALAQWLQFIGASAAYGQIQVNTLRDNFTAVNSPAQLWIEVQDEVCTNDWQQPGTNCNGSWSASETIPLHYTFDTPVGAAASSLCGKVLFEDYHVEDAVTGGTVFPAECPGGTMTPQEKLLEFELFDLASCITPVQTVTPTCIPRTCADQGIQCGPAGDGCGGVASDTDGGTTCGTCSSPETCGGGGVPGVCGGTACARITCASQGIQCGPAGDGCGDLIQCSVCPNGTTCGGGGVPGVCGKPSCTMISCSSQGVQCGPAGDGCGGLLNCGACPSGQTCGGGGTPGKCGAPDGGGTTTCPAETCASQGLHCGPAGDGCGNLIQCGTCTPPQTCGGGGTPGVCGGSGCVSTSCSALGYNCGPTGDGCGNVLQCGTCPANQSCGGGGTPGVCGSACTPGSCASLEINCGPAGNGCGGLLQCGTCTLPETCGGGGVAGQCGASTIK